MNEDDGRVVVPGLPFAIRAEFAEEVTRLEARRKHLFDVMTAEGMTDERSAEFSVIVDRIAGIMFTGDPEHFEKNPWVKRAQKS